MRESMGIESWLYGMIEVCTADVLLQFGFDETAIDLQSTMDMWALVEKKGRLRVVSIQVISTPLTLDITFGHGPMCKTPPARLWRQGWCNTCE